MSNSLAFSVPQSWAPEAQEVVRASQSSASPGPSFHGAKASSAVPAITSVVAAAVAAAHCSHSKARIPPQLQRLPRLAKGGTQSDRAETATAGATHLLQRREVSQGGENDFPESRLDRAWYWLRNKSEVGWKAARKGWAKARGHTSELLKKEARLQMLADTSPSVVYVTGKPTPWMPKEVPEGGASPGGTAWMFDRRHVVTSLSNIDLAQRGSLRVIFEDRTELPARVDVTVVGRKPALDMSVSRGVVYGLGQPLVLNSDRPVQSSIQTDAVIQASNRGGPLLNSRGQVIGMAIGPLEESRISQAIPADSLRKYVQSILDNGHVSRPALGIYLEPDGFAERLGAHGVVEHDNIVVAAAQVKKLQEKWPDLAAQGPEGAKAALEFFSNVMYSTLTIKVPAGSSDEEQVVNDVKKAKQEGKEMVFTVQRLSESPWVTLDRSLTEVYATVDSETPLPEPDQVSDMLRDLKNNLNLARDDDVAKNHGADAVRMYMLNSGEEGVRDVVKDVFLPMFNAYRFLVQESYRYEGASGKKFSPESAKVKASTNHMDQWIFASMHGLIQFEMEAYRLYTVVPQLVDFLEDLTNWYVRLNRDRMRGSNGLEEAFTSLSALYEVLLNVTVCLAPVVPFITEHIYQNLARALPDGHPLKAKSVHWVMIPEPDLSVRSLELDI
eukprot:s1623_g1.t1